MKARPFILSLASPKTGSAAHQLRFFADPVHVAAALGHEGDISFLQFDLEEEDMQRLASRFGLFLPQWPQDATLRMQHPLDDAPYLIHTGYELPLMLEGRKPFAVFIDTRLDERPAFETLRSLFHPHVEAGQIMESLSCTKQAFPTTAGGEKEAWETQLF